MRRRTAVLVAAVSAFAVGATVMQASCGSPGRVVSQAKDKRVASGVPAAYRDKVVVYSTGESRVFSLRLDGSKPKLLFQSREPLDSRGLLLPIPERKELLYDFIYKGSTDLMVYSAETGERKLLAPHVDYRPIVGLEGTRSAVYLKESEVAEVVDLQTRKTKRLPLPGPSLSGSDPTTMGQAFIVARSDVRFDPIDQDLYFRPVGGDLIKVASAPHKYGIDDVRVLPDAVLFTEVELGGEWYGTVSVWSTRTRKSMALARDARILDVSPSGAILLAERVSRREEQTPDGLSIHETSRIVYFGQASETPRRLPRLYEDVSWVTLADNGHAALSYLKNNAWHLDAIDLVAMRWTPLALPSARIVSQIEPLDGKAVLVVTDRSGPGGIAADSNMLWMPLNGSRPITLATTDSGFIRMSRPYACKD